MIGCVLLGFLVLFGTAVSLVGLVQGLGWIIGTVCNIFGWPRIGRDRIGDGLFGLFCLFVLAVLTLLASSIGEAICRGIR